MLDSHEAVEETLLAALLGISEMMGDLADSEEFLETVVRIAPRLTSVSRCAIFLRSPDGDAFHAVHAFAGDASAVALLLHTAIPAAEAPGLVRRILEQRIPVIFREGREPLLPPGLVRTHNVRSALLVPITFQNEALGFIALDDPGRNHVFTSRDVNVVNAIAYHVAVALVHTRLVEALREMRRRADLIADALCDGVVTLDADFRIVRLNRKAETLLGWSSVDLAGRSWADLVGVGPQGGSDAFRTAEVLALRAKDTDPVACLVTVVDVPSAAGRQYLLSLQRVYVPSSPDVARE